jgi:hypothetical protein
MVRGRIGGRRLGTAAWTGCAIAAVGAVLVLGRVAVERAWSYREFRQAPECATEVSGRDCVGSAHLRVVERERVEQGRNDTYRVYLSGRDVPSAWVEVTPGAFEALPAGTEVRARVWHGDIVAFRSAAGSWRTDAAPEKSFVWAVAAVLMLLPFTALAAVTAVRQAKWRGDGPYRHGRAMRAAFGAGILFALLVLVGGLAVAG